MDAIRIQADAIIVSPDVIYRPGQIVVRSGRIHECTADCSQPADLALPDSVLSARLVNAHCHLEFSDLEQPFEAGQNFPEWIGRVVRHRRTMAENHSEQEFRQLRRLAWLLGLAESRAAGVALIGDILTQPWIADHLLRQSELRSTSSLRHLVPLIVKNDVSLAWCSRHCAVEPWVFAFPEIIGMDETRFIESVLWAQDLAALHPSPKPIWKVGLSPHAPYSIHFPTAKRILASDFSCRQLTAMHVAESLEEREWLATGQGPFREVFERLGVPGDQPRPSIAETIAWLNTRKRALLIHGNYLESEEIAQIANSSISVVYCPRTHRHFAHSPYPLRALVNAHINVVLGTDSRASNPDLDLWNEVLEARAMHPWISPQWAYAAVTQRAAEALGVEEHFGSLLPGRFAAINLSPFNSSSSAENLLDELTTRPQPFTPLERILALAAVRF